jgi:hypothetical protein
MSFHRSGRLHSRTSQQGMGLLVILLIIGLLVAIASAVAALSRGQGSSSDAEKSRLDASTIISQGGMLVNSAVRYSQDRPLSSMTLDTTAGTGLYDPNLALTSQNDAPTSATTTGAASAFEYDSTSINVTGLGTSAAEPAVWVPDLKDSVCRQINKALWGDAIDAAIPTSVGSRQEGCAELGATPTNTYFKVIIPG